MCVQVFSFLTENFLGGSVGIGFCYRCQPQMRTLGSSLAFCSEFQCLLLCNSMSSQNLKIPISPGRKRHLLTLTFCVVLVCRSVHLVQNVLAVLVFLLGLDVSYSKGRRKKGFLNSGYVWFLLSVLDMMSRLKCYQ